MNVGEIFDALPSRLQTISITMSRKVVEKLPIEMNENGTSNVSRVAHVNITCPSVFMHAIASINPLRFSKTNQLYVSTRHYYDLASIIRSLP